MNRSVHIYKYDAGGFCTQHTLYYCGYLGDFRIGSILCILNPEHTGGRITTQMHGQTYSIEHPGECMALQLGCSYAVEEVTSGTLELLEFTMYSVDNKEEGKSTLEWIYPGVPTTQKIDTVYNDILSAVAA